MKKNTLRVISLLTLCAVMVLAGVLTGCTPKVDGAMPQFAIGDTWVVRWYTGGVEYIVTSEITGEDNYNGKDCWVMQTAFEPYYMNLVTGTTNRYEKADLDIVSLEYHTTSADEFTFITYEIEGTAFYPLFVGKESTEISHEIITSGDAIVTQTENVTTTVTTEVEKIEEITVEAGTFNCFKVNKYDEDGNLIQVAWRSDKTKLFQVMMYDPDEEDAEFELISYTMH